MHGILQDRIKKTSRRGAHVLTAAFLSLTALGLPINVRAEPTGADVVQGQATVTYQGPNTTINQSTDKAVINWQDFSVGPGEHTAFQVPNQFSSTLNRVVGNNLSMIFGKLTSNGQMYLINPNGIVFAHGSEVDVNSLFASTLDMKDQDFMNGVYAFSQKDGKFLGKILNQGTIRADEHGNVALIAPSIDNQGLITATKGAVVLGAGTKATVDFDGDGKLLFALADDSRLFDANGNALGVNSSGQIINNGGQVIIQANTAKSVLDQAVNVSGLVKAASIKDEAGTYVGSVAIKGGMGRVDIAGILDLAAVRNANGGKVDVRGGDIRVASTAKVDVSADEVGNAGSIIIYSDEHTEVRAQLMAMGGKQGGDGGFIETSSHGTLDINGAYVNTNSPYGGVGTWLLDPPDYLIDAGAAATITAGLANTNVMIETEVIGAGTGNIYMNSSLTVPSGKSLTLKAYNDIIFGAGAVITNAGTVNLVADSTGAAQDSGGRGTIVGNSGIHVSGGSLTLYYRPYSSNGAGTLDYTLGSTFFSAFTNSSTTRWELISSTADGQKFMTDSNSGGGFYNHNIFLTRNITAWTAPVNNFSGQFFGNEKTIGGRTYTVDASNFGLFKQINSGYFYNLRLDGIAMNWSSGTFSYIGLLAGLANNSYVNDLIVTNSSISTSTGANSRVGLVFGEMSATLIYNSSVQGSLYAPTAGGSYFGGYAGYFQSASTIQSSTSNVGVSVGSTSNGTDSVGGFVGYANVSGGSGLGNLVNYGAVTALGGVNFMGGIAGQLSGTNSGGAYLSNFGSITGPYTGSYYLSYAGGIIGYLSGNSGFAFAYNYGSVSGSQRIGGIIGEASLSSLGTVSTVMNTGTVSGTNYVGGIVGLMSGGNYSDLLNMGGVGLADINIYSEGFGGIVGLFSWAHSMNRVANYSSVSGRNMIGGIFGLMYLGNNSMTINNVVSTGYVYARESNIQAQNGSLATAGLGGIVGYAITNTNGTISTNFSNVLFTGTLVMGGDIPNGTNVKAGGLIGRLDTQNNYQISGTLFNNFASYPSFEISIYPSASAWNNTSLSVTIGYAMQSSSGVILSNGILGSVGRSVVWQGSSSNNRTFYVCYDTCTNRVDSSNIYHDTSLVGQYFGADWMGPGSSGISMTGSGWVSMNTYYAPSLLNSTSFVSGFENFDVAGGIRSVFVPTGLFSTNGGNSINIQDATGAADSSLSGTDTHVYYGGSEIYIPTHYRAYSQNSGSSTALQAMIGWGSSVTLGRPVIGSSAPSIMLFNGTNFDYFKTVSVGNPSGTVMGSAVTSGYGPASSTPIRKDTLTINGIDTIRHGARMNTGYTTTLSLGSSTQIFNPSITTNLNLYILNSSSALGMQSITLTGAAASLRSDSYLMVKDLIIGASAANDVTISSNFYIKPGGTVQINRLNANNSVYFNYAQNLQTPDYLRGASSSSLLMNRGTSRGLLGVTGVYGHGYSGLRYVNGVWTDALATATLDLGTGTFPVSSTYSVPQLNLTFSGAFPTATNISTGGGSLRITAYNGFSNGSNATLNSKGGLLGLGTGTVTFASADVAAMSIPSTVKDLELSTVSAALNMDSTVLSALPWYAGLRTLSFKTTSGSMNLTNGFTATQGLTVDVGTGVGNLGGTYTTAGTFNVLSGNAGEVHFNGPVSAASMSTTGTGWLDFNNNVTLSGALAINANRLSFGAYTFTASSISVPTITSIGANGVSIANGAVFSSGSAFNFNVINNGAIVAGGFTSNQPVSLNTAAGNITLGGTFAVSGGALSAVSSGGGAISTTANVTNSGGAVTLNTSGVVTLGHTLSAGGALNVTGSSITANNNLSATGLMNLSTAGALSILRDLTAGGTLSLTGSTITHSGANAGTWASTGAMTVTGAFSNSGSDIALNAGGNLTFSQAVVSNNAKLTVGGAIISLPGYSGTNADLTINQTGAFAFGGGAYTIRNLTVNGGTFDRGATPLVLTGDLNGSGVALFSTGGVTVPGAVNLTSMGVWNGAITAGGVVSYVGLGNFTGNVSTTNLLSVSAQNITGTMAGGDVNLVTAEAFTGDITAENDLTLELAEIQGGQILVGGGITATGGSYRGATLIATRAVNANVTGAFDSIVRSNNSSISISASRIGGTFNSKTDMTLTRAGIIAGNIVSGGTLFLGGSNGSNLFGTVLGYGGSLSVNYAKLLSGASGTFLINGFKVGGTSLFQDIGVKTLFQTNLADTVYSANKVLAPQAFSAAQLQIQTIVSDLHANQAKTLSQTPKFDFLPRMGLNCSFVSGDDVGLMRCISQ